MGEIPSADEILECFINDTTGDFLNICLTANNTLIFRDNREDNANVEELEIRDWYTQFQEFYENRDRSYDNVNDEHFNVIRGFNCFIFAQIIIKSLTAQIN
ncbi:uncharacterized protein LOC119679646 [Teleopsis dalmanni]|uniref:uncharacterized protein LOC119679646 n=1 Tax=Teleopsis dalmanni TaxID=139649 RepID=UPI0018CDD893|nr:uncharacterized protein LOC119679646 [Teleopsis dalmanni]